MLPQFDKDLHKVVNESVSLLPDKPDNELYKSFLTVANDSSGFLKLLFSKSQQKNNSIAALAGSYVLIEAITMWKMASFKNFSLSDYHNLFWTLSFQEFLRVNGQNQISFDTFKQILVISSKNYQKVKLPSPIVSRAYQTKIRFRRWEPSLTSDASHPAGLSQTVCL